MSKNKKLCACESGKPAALCCATGLALTREAKIAMRADAEALASLGRYGEACEVLERLVALSPRNPLIWNDLGIAYEGAGELEKALAALERGHRVDPNYPPVLYNLGKFSWELYQRMRGSGVMNATDLQALLRRAIAYLNANLDLDRGNADGHFYLGLAYAADGDERKAQGHMAVAMRLREQLADLP